MHDSLLQRKHAFSLRDDSRDGGDKMKSGIRVEKARMRVPGSGGYSILSPLPSPLPEGEGADGKS